MRLIDLATQTCKPFQYKNLFVAITTRIVVRFETKRFWKCKNVHFWGMKQESAETKGSNLPIKERKDLAKLLFTRGVVQTQKELSERVKVSEQTIVKWVRDGKWEEEKRSLLVVRYEQLARLYRMLERKVTTLEAMEAEGGQISTKDTDIIVKLTGAIRSLEVEVSVADIIEVFMKFNDWSRQNGAALETLKEIGVLQDGFIKSRI
jgi:hypothetical protein